MNIKGMVHNGDPETSSEAASFILRNKTELHEMVLKAFDDEGPMTDWELENLPQFERFGPSTIRKRRSELYQMGNLEKYGKKKNPSGRNMIQWQLVTGDPVPKFTSLEQRLKYFGFESLDEYTRSDIWSNRKIGYYSRHPKVCFITGATTNIDLHHIRYDNLANEPDEDLVPLRTFWHKYVHHLVKEYKVKLEVAHLVARDSYRVSKIYDEKY